MNSTRDKYRAARMYGMTAVCALRVAHIATSVGKIHRTLEDKRRIGVMREAWKEFARIQRECKYTTARLSWYAAYCLARAQLRGY